MFSKIHPLKEIASYHSQIKRSKFEETIYSILCQQNCKHFIFFYYYFKYWAAKFSPPSTSDAQKLQIKKKKYLLIPNSKEDWGF